MICRCWWTSRAALSFVEAAAKIRLARRKHGIGLAVLDYLQLMRGDGDNRNQELEGITRGLQALSKELGIRSTALSQLFPEVRRAHQQAPLPPTCANPADRADADVVLMIYRDEASGTPDSDDKWARPKSSTSPSSAGAPTGRIRTVFMGEYASFAN